MQRILHVIGKMDRAGAETMIMNLYRKIDKAQFQFDFIVFSKQAGDFDEEIKSLGGRIFTILGRNAIIRMFQLKKLLLNHPEYKIIHCHTLFSNAFHILSGKMAHLPFRIAHSHNTSDQSKNKVIGLLYTSISKMIMHKYATHFISCGKAAAEFLFPKEKDVLILPNSIDTAFFAEIGHSEKDYLNKEFDIDDSFLKIIQVGRLLTVKNHIFSIKIALDLKSKNIPFKMFFIGQGDLYNQIKNEIKRNNLEQHVLLLGLRSDIPEIMAGADVMLMPSLHEGFPVVLVEAQAVGLPSVISDSISLEVDLNVGLIKFESLNNTTENWINNLVSIKRLKKMNAQDRLKELAVQGFDIHSSVETISELYKVME